MIEYHTIDESIYIRNWNGKLRMSYVVKQKSLNSLTYEKWIDDHPLYSNEKLEFEIANNKLKKTLIDILIKSELFTYIIVNNKYMFKLNASELIKLI